MTRPHKGHRISSYKSSGSTPRTASMTVMFFGPSDDSDYVHLTNGQAARLLVAIGYAPRIEDIVSTDGEMPIALARSGIERAKGLVSEPDDILVLEELGQIVAEIEDSGGDKLTWS